MILQCIAYNVPEVVAIIHQNLLFLDFSTYFQIPIVLRFLCIELSYLQEDEKSNNCDEDKAKYCPLGKDNTMCNFCGINLEACHESFCKHGLSEVRAISTASF